MHAAAAQLSLRHRWLVRRLLRSLWSRGGAVADDGQRLRERQQQKQKKKQIPFGALHVAAARALHAADARLSPRHRWLVRRLLRSRWSRGGAMRTLGSGCGNGSSHSKSNGHGNSTGKSKRRSRFPSGMTNKGVPDWWLPALRVPAFVVPAAWVVPALVVPALAVSALRVPMFVASSLVVRVHGWWMGLGCLGG